jgi:hypothetical protein
MAGVPCSVRGVTDVGGVVGGVVVGGVVVVVDVVPVDVPVAVLPDVAAALWELELNGTPPEQAAIRAAITINPANLTIRSPIKPMRAVQCAEVKGLPESPQRVAGWERSKLAFWGRARGKSRFP